WDVGTDGSRALVTRGVYRGGPSLGPLKITYELFGNAWRFRKGHSVELELLQDDSTFLRADNFASAVTIDSARLELPLRRAAVVASTPDQLDSAYADSAHFDPSRGG